MKKFLLFTLLFAAIFGTHQSAKAQCQVKNLVFKINSYTPNSNGSCTIVFNIGWDQFSNNGNKWSYVHLWLAGDYPGYTYSNAPTNAQLNSSKAIGSIVINNSVIQSSYPNGSGSSPVLTGTFSKTSIPNNGMRYLIQNVSKTFTTCPSSLDIKGDVWSAQDASGKNVACFDKNLTFLPPATDLNITGSIDCAYKNGYPDNKFNVGMTSTNAASEALTVSYDVYADNGNGSFDPASDAKATSRTVSNITVSSSQPYSLGPVDYAPYSKDYAYLGRPLWISATAVTKLGNTFTRLLQIASNCSTTPGAPSVNNDYFDEQGHPLNTIKANVYGGQVHWTNDLGASSEYLTTSSSEPPAVDHGLDTEPTDATLAQMEFELVAGSLTQYTSCNNSGNIVFSFNANGTFSIDRSDNICVNKVTFQYKVKNTVTNQVSNTALVTITFSTNAVTPVTFKTFTATRKEDKVALVWETSMEQANKGFYLQRNDGSGWKDIAFVFSQAENGNSSTTLRYQYSDAHNSKAVTHYRILQVDLDGKGRYSNSVAVPGNGAAKRLMLFPNPSANGKVTLLFEGQGTRQVQVRDLSGRLVQQFHNVSASSLAISNLGSGFYTVQVQDVGTGKLTIEKFIIKKR